MEAVYILHIETSGTGCSVALSDHGTCIHQEQSQIEWRHSRELTVLIQKLLLEHLPPECQLKAVGVSAGPGSYTGLRVGVSTAKALCYAKDIPLIAVSTLEIIAFPFKERLAHLEFIIATIDARRKELYYQVFDQAFNAVTEPDNLILDENSFHVYKNALICGDATMKSSEIIQSNSRLVYEPSRPEAQFMPELAYAKYLEKDFEDLAYFAPFYMKPPNITKSQKPLF